MERDIERACEAARSARHEGRSAEALQHYGEAASLARARQDGAALAYALRHLSDLAREHGDAATALAAGDEAVTLYRLQDGGLDLANALRLRALALETLERSGEAQSAWQEARGLYADAGIDAGVQECDRHLVPPS